MKFTVKKTTVAKQQPTLDVAATEAALVESYESMSAAYESLVAIGGEISECAKVMDDCKTAMESIQKFGVTAAAMDLFNGENHNLDKALGLESLAVESIASLSKDAKEMLKANYTAGLEGKFADAIKAFVITVKRWFAQFANWIREVFNGNAKMIRLVKELKFENLDADKTVKVIGEDQAVAIAGLIKDIDVALNAPVGEGDISKSTANLEAAKEQLGDEFMKKVAAAIEKKEGKVSELKWDAAKAKAMAAKFETIAADAGVMKGWKAAQADYNVAIKQAGEDKSKLDIVRLRFEFVKFRGKCVSVHTKLVRALGTSLMTLAKATKKAAKEESKA